MQLFGPNPNPLTLTLRDRTPAGCILSPLLFSLYTNSCTSSHQSGKLLKFADDTTLIGLISGGDESAYRWEIDYLATWCSLGAQCCEDSGDGWGLQEECSGGGAGGGFDSVHQLSVAEISIQQGYPLERVSLTDDALVLSR